MSVREAVEQGIAVIETIEQPLMPPEVIAADYRLQFSS
jgi:hypothetical protein